jgi:hypothetical protein
MVDGPAVLDGFLVADGLDAEWVLSRMHFLAIMLVLSLRGAEEVQCLLSAGLPGFWFQQHPRVGAVSHERRWRAEWMAVDLHHGKSLS